MTITRGFRTDRKKKLKGKWLYMGGLEKEIGKKQAKAFVKKEKYQEKADKQGDMQYYYIEQSEALEGTLRHQATLEQKGSRDAKTMNSIEAAFTDWFNTDANPTRMQGIDNYDMPSGSSGRLRKGLRKTLKAVMMMMMMMVMMKKKKKKTRRRKILEYHRSPLQKNL